MNMNEQQLILELEKEQQEIDTIHRQRNLIYKVESTLCRKEKEMERLSALVQQYRPSHEKYTAIRLDLVQKDSIVKSLTRQNQLLRRQFEKLLHDCQQLTQQLKISEMQKQTLIRERHGIERVNREIEQTFKQYQAECRQKEYQLTSQLDQAYQSIDTLTKTLDQAKADKSLREASKDQIKKHDEQIQKLQAELTEKEKQLQKTKILNHELSLEFDRSVSKIGQFEKDLNGYRRQNQQLKKTLGLVLEQQKYAKLHEKFLRQRGGESQQEEEQDLSSNGEIESSPSMSEIKL